MAAPSSAARDKSGITVTRATATVMASMTGFVVFMIAFLSFAIQPPSGNSGGSRGLNRLLRNEPLIHTRQKNAATDLSAFRLTCLGVGF